MIKITVDNRELQVAEGANLLKTCLENGTYIPNLCYMETPEHPPASCRLCFVEVAGRNEPVPSCRMETFANMVVRTDTPAVRRLQRTALELLLSVHHVDCGRCPANKKCELQKIARFLKVGLKPNRLERFLKDQDIFADHPFLNHHPNRCVLCGKCVRICGAVNDVPQMAFAGRGFETLVRFYGENGSGSLPCDPCQRCVHICPVGALTLKTPFHALES